MFGSNANISTNVDPGIITHSLNNTNIPPPLIGAVESYFSALRINDPAMVMNEIVKTLNSGKCTATTNNECLNHIRKVYRESNTDELVNLYSKVLCALGALVSSRNGSSDTGLFYTAVNIGCNAYMHGVVRKHNADPSMYFQGNDIQQINQFRDIVGRYSGGSVNSNAFGGSSGGFTVNTNSGHSVNSYQTTNTVNGDSIDLFGESKAIVEATTFGGDNQWTHTTAHGTETFGSNHTANTQANFADTPNNHQTNHQATILKSTGALTAMSDEWETLKTSHKSDLFKGTPDNSELEEDLEVKEKPNMLFHLDCDPSAMVSLSNAARRCILNRQTNNQFVSMCVLVGDDVDLTEEDVLNLQAIRTYMARTETVISVEDEQRHGRNSYPYVVHMLQRIDDSFVRSAMLNYMVSLINNYVIIRAGISMMIDDIVVGNTMLTKNMQNKIQSGTFVGNNDDRALFQRVIADIEKVVCKNVLDKLTVLRVDDISVITLANPVMVIASPLTATELGLQFDEPLLANRITQNSTPVLWDIVDTCLESVENRPTEICIYTADGQFITGYESVFSDDGSIIDLFDLSEVAYYNKM